MSTVVARYAIPALWVAWLVYWQIAATNVKATRRAESTASRLTYIVPTIMAIVLIAVPRLWTGWLAERFLPPSWTGYWIGVAVLAVSLVYSVRARIYLGRNWSSNVTLKEDHQLIRSGPYRFIRHPIYTGIIGGFVGTAIALGQWRGVLAVMFAIITFIRKLSIEERLMMEAFPAEYPGYRAQSWALIPFVF